MCLQHIVTFVFNMCLQCLYWLCVSAICITRLHSYGAGCLWQMALIIHQSQNRIKIFYLAAVTVSTHCCNIIQWTIRWTKKKIQLLHCKLKIHIIDTNTKKWENKSIEMVLISMESIWFDSNIPASNCNMVAAIAVVVVNFIGNVSIVEFIAV